MLPTKDISIMIADDEISVLNNTIQKILLCETNFHVIGTANDGLEVLQLLETKIPDILITDIEMPNLNGLDLIRYISTQYPSVHIVILSKSNRFEDIHTAMQLGVKDYLLKPVSQLDLSSVLLKLSEKILQKKKSEFRNIIALTLSEPNACPLPSDCFVNERFLLLFFTLGNLPSKYTKPLYSYTPSSFGKNFSLTDCFHGMQGIRHIWIIDESYPLQKFIILGLDDTEVNFSLLSHNIYTELTRQLENLPFYLVTDNRTISYTEIQTAAIRLRQFTMQTLKMCTQEQQVFTDHISFPEVFFDPRLKNLFPYQFNSMPQLIKFVGNTLKYYIENDAPEQYIDDFLYEIYHAIPYAFSFHPTHCLNAINGILSRLPYFTAPRELYTATSKFLNELYQQNAKEITPKLLCEKMYQYLKANYTRKITTESLSKLFGYTPAYLNRIYKKEHGVSPLQYITFLRIDAAKKLLKRNIKTKDIAILLGFEDAHYFSRVFRQETGLSPSAWKCKNIGLKLERDTE